MSDIHRDDEAYRKYRESMFDLEDMRSASPGDTIMDIAASTMALAELGVAHGLWDEREFIAAKLRAKHWLEQHQARMQDQAVDNAIDMLRNQAQLIRSLSFRFCVEFWQGQEDDYSIHVLRLPLRNTRGEVLSMCSDIPGQVVVRAVSDRFQENFFWRKMTMEQYLHNRLASDASLKNISVMAIPLRRSELNSDHNAFFEQCVVTHSMEEVEGVFQRRVAGHSGESEDEGPGGDEPDMGGGLPGISI